MRADRPSRFGGPENQPRREGNFPLLLLLLLCERAAAIIRDVDVKSVLSTCSCLLPREYQFIVRQCAFYRNFLVFTTGRARVFREIKNSAYQP